MTRQSVDIFISGGGLAGLAAAATFADAGLSVLLADPAPPITDGGQSGADRRSTAFLQPARALFEQIGLWDDLATEAVPLDALRIVDSAGDPPEIRDLREFRASDMGDEPFGWNLLNWLTRGKLLAHLERQPKVEMAFGTGFRSLLTRTTEAIVTLDDGRHVSARLAIAADGRNSPLREAAGLTVKTTRYGQKSLAFTATHAEPHGNISTEIYHRGGPFTVVPLPDLHGLPASAIVWMNEGRRSLDLAALPRPELEAEMNRRSCGMFGPMSVASEIQVWPIITQRAEGLVAERVALIAEAAHVLPPIGAQGLNTSLHDVAALAEAIAAGDGDPGAPEVLARFAKARERDIRARAGIIDLFNRVTRSPDAMVQAMRLTGLKAVHDIAPLRRGVMAAGMGPR
ncbi:MAG: FAD-dependent monooxygenase [Rhodobacteraceae bacterium]|nr:FAD-dependent monooxygenase [Paracoccaceae bacterium]